MMVAARSTRCDRRTKTLSKLIAKCVLSLAVATSACGSQTDPPIPEPDDEAVCAAGTDVEFLAARLDPNRGCADEDVVAGTCEAFEVFLTRGAVDPPESPCSLDAFSFTEVATGDCLRVYPRCPGILDDPRFEDCSRSNEATCCGWGEDEGVWYPWCLYAE